MVKKTKKNLGEEKKLLDRPERTLIRDLEAGLLDPKECLEKCLGELTKKRIVCGDNFMEDRSFKKYEIRFSELVEYIGRTYGGVDVNFYKSLVVDFYKDFEDEKDARILKMRENSLRLKRESKGPVTNEYEKTMVKIRNI